MRDRKALPDALHELAGEYEFLGELGTGGMAVVYLARDRATSHEVAIKLIRAKYIQDEETLARCAREAETVMRLRHPNIVRTYAARQLSDGSLALVLEHVPGRTLRQILNEEGALSFERTERILRDVAAALSYAHQSGTIHRDVKPENICVNERTGAALLSDFGIAKSADSDTRITHTGVTIGTPVYMSPEQIDGLGVDARTDIYSLGMVGWEMLSGTRPWEGAGLYSVVYKQKNEPLPALEQLRPDVPTHLWIAIEGALLKNREERWASIGDFLVQLDPGAEEHPSRSAVRRRQRVVSKVLTTHEQRSAELHGARRTLRFRRSAAPAAARTAVRPGRVRVPAVIAATVVLLAGGTAIVAALNGRERDAEPETPLIHALLDPAAEAPTTAPADLPASPVPEPQTDSTVMPEEPVPAVAEESDAVEDEARPAANPAESTSAPARPAPSVKPTPRTPTPPRTAAAEQRRNPPPAGRDSPQRPAQTVATRDQPQRPREQPQRPRDQPQTAREQPQAAALREQRAPPREAARTVVETATVPITTAAAPPAAAPPAAAPPAAAPPAAPSRAEPRRRSGDSVSCNSSRFDPFDQHRTADARCSIRLVVGESYRMHVAPGPLSGERNVARPIAWSSSKPSVASVDREGLVRALRPGGATIAAIAGDLGGTATILVVAGPPAPPVIVSGNGQTGAAGARLPSALVVRVTDSQGNPLNGVPVAWQVIAGDGAVRAVRGQTNARGLAEARWSLGQKPGSQAVTATVAGLPSVTFTAVASPPRTE